MFVKEQWNRRIHIISHRAFGAGVCSYIQNSLLNLKNSWHCQIYDNFYKSISFRFENSRLFDHLFSFKFSILMRLSKNYKFNNNIERSKWKPITKSIKGTLLWMQGYKRLVVYIITLNYDLKIYFRFHRNLNKQYERYHNSLWY